MAIINYIENYSKIHRFNMHSHQYWEILYVMKSDGYFEFFNSSPIHYKKGDILCIPPNVSHTNHPNSGFQNINLTISNWNPPIKEPTLITNVESEDFYHILEQAYRHFHKANPPKDIVYTLTKLIIQYIEYYSLSPQISNISLTIINAIVENFHNASFDWSTIYNQFPFSKEVLRKKFIAEVGISPSQYLTRIRIDNAVQLLTKKATADYSIKDIAEKCGFVDQLYFSRVFKKIMNVSPSNYQLKFLSDNKIDKSIE